MAEKFKPLIHYNSDSLHIKLRGGFDPEAATQLIRLIASYRRTFKKIFVHTSFLDSIDAAGTDAFKHGFALPLDDMDAVVFTGDNAERIAPFVWQVL